MVRFITKTVCMALMVMLCVGVNAQNAPQMNSKNLPQVSLSSAAADNVAPEGMVVTQSNPVNTSGITNFTKIPVGGRGDGYIYGVQGYYGMPQEHVKVLVANPGQGTTQSPFPIGTLSGEFYMDDYYCAEQYGAFYKVDHETGAYIQLTTHGDGSGITFFNDLTYDYSNDVMYGLWGQNQLYTIDLETGTRTFVTSITGGGAGLITIACNLEGDMYGIDMTSGAKMYSIDKTTGVCTLIGPTGLNSAYAQGSTFDHETGIYYWCNYQGGGLSRLCTMDLTTGAATPINTTNIGEICGAYFVFYNDGLDPCPTVTNVTAEKFEGNKVLVNWTAAPGDVAEYKIYQNSMEKATVDAETTTWTSAALANGTYTFAVAAVYGDECKPVKVAAPSVTIKSCDSKVTGLDVEYTPDCSTAIITWDDLNGKKSGYKPAIQTVETLVREGSATREIGLYSLSDGAVKAEPAGNDPDFAPNDWIKWTTGAIDDALGNASYPIDMIGAMRFLPSDLTSLGIASGDVVSKVRFGIYNAISSSYVIQIRQGGSSPTSPGVVMYEQTVTQSLNMYSFNEVTLTTPYAINASQELWVCIKIQTSPGYYLGVDSGPGVFDKGDIICWNGDWSTLGSGFNANWCIGAYVESGPDIAKDPNPCTVTPAGTQLKANLAWTNPTQTVGGVNLTSISKMVVKRGTDVIWESTGTVTPGQEMTYTDDAIPSPGQHCYQVYAVTSTGEGLKGIDCGVFGALCDVTVIITPQCTYNDSYGWSLTDDDTGEVIMSGAAGAITKTGFFTGSATFAAFQNGSYDDNCAIVQVLVDEIEVINWMAYFEYGYYQEESIFCEAGDISYNIYRDYVKIGGPQEEAIFEDTTFDPEQEHIWSVAIVCKNGGDSEWVSKNMIACGESCDDATNIEVEITCELATITWAPVDGATGYKVNGEAVEGTTYTEEGEFEKGETYTWTIVTVCASGESEGVEVSGETDCVGINEMSNTVAIFPNPTSGMITIKATNFAKVEVYNTVGQLVETKTATTFDVSTYSTGVYFFKVYDANNNSVTKRVMVTK